jgi:dihydroorotase (multifunctional complex type)
LRGRSLSFRGGRVYTPTGWAEADVLVGAGRVVEVGHELRGDDEVDASGLWVVPGAVDAHVHSRDPGFPEKETWATLTAAAAAGGVTTVVDMPNTVPAVDSGDVLREKAARAEARAIVDFALWGLIRSTSTAEALDGLAAAGAIGFKAYLGYAYRRSSRSVTYTPELDDPDLEAAPDYGTIARLALDLRRLGLPLAAHSEDASVLRAMGRPPDSYDALLAARPAAAEAVAVGALGALAAALGFPLQVVHVASAAGLAAALGARAQGADLSIETCPQYLWTTEADYERLGNALRMNPPVRTAADREALRSAVAAGDVDSIGTDHAPHTDREKFGEPLATCHPGSPGVQTLLVSTLQLGGELGVERAIDLVAASPAYRLGLYPRKGAIVPGSDADLVLVDPTGRTEVRAERMHSKQKHGVLEGMVFDFSVREVYSRGELVARSGEVVGEPGRGRFLRPLSDVRPSAEPA